MSPEHTRSYSHRVTRCFLSDLAVAEVSARVLFTRSAAASPQRPTATTLHPVTPLSRIFTCICASVLPDITSFRARYSPLPSVTTEKSTTRRSLWLTQQKHLLPSISTVSTRVDQADRHLVEPALPTPSQARHPRLDTIQVDA